MKTNLSKTIKIGLVLLAAALSSNLSWGATYTAVATGKWSSTLTWGGTVPPRTLSTLDQVTIGSGITVTMDSTITLNGVLSQLSIAGTLSSAATDSLIVTTGTLTGAGSIMINSLVLNSAAVLSFTGSMVVNDLTNAVAGLSSTGTVTINNALNLTGIISIQTGGTLTMGSNSVVNINGASISVSGGTLNLSSVYDVNYTSSSTTSGMELSGTGLGKVTVNVTPTNSVTLSSNVTLNDSLKLTSGSLTLNGYNLTLNGQVYGYGTFMGDANANLIINTTGGLTVPIYFASGSQLLNNLTLNLGPTNTVILGTNLAIDGTLKVSSGNTFNIDGVMLTLNGSYSGTGVLKVNTKSRLDIEATSSITTAIPLSGSIGYFKLNINSGNIVTMGSDLTVDTLNLATGVLVLNAHNLSINGDIAAAGSGLVMSTSTSNVSVTAANSTTDSLSFFSAGNTVNNFTVNIGAAGSVRLGSDLVVNGTLGFISGHVDVRSHNLQIAATGNITGYNINSYVITGTGGYLTMNAAISTAANFPVGTASYYSPASITLNTGSAIGTVGVSASTGVYSNGTTGSLLSTTEPMVNSTWYFETSITSGLNATMQLTWQAATEVNGFVHKGDYISHFTAGAWDNINDSMTAVAVSGGMYTIERASVTSMSPFAVFDQSTVTGINEATAVINDGIVVYPNPASNSLYIQNNTGSTGALYADIYNVLGQKVASFEITNSNTTLPLDGLKTGDYFIRLNNSNMNVVKKFVKL
ncbi:MAG TPA: T9SS type A sorting domain-containing protein [Bacteroidia bacterium]|nr:T9SS type A sorting domain-containing protein [Bacteroidia bacterium]